MDFILLMCTCIMTLAIVKGEGSYCTTGARTQLEMSVYLRVCCVNSNLGQTVQMREYNHVRIIVCPSVKPYSCPPGKWNFVGANNIINYFKFIETVRAGLMKDILTVVSTLLILMNRLHFRLYIILCLHWHIFVGQHGSAQFV